MGVSYQNWDPMGHRLGSYSIRLASPVRHLEVGHSDRSLYKAELPGRVTRKLVTRCSIRISGKLPSARRRAAPADGADA